MIDIKRVLIVDDHQHIRESLKNYLLVILPHSEIMEANNGRHALSLIPANPPDLILMDMTMPVMDGLQTTRYIKHHWPALKIIMLTVEGGQRQEALNAGADAFLIKGITSDRLLETIRALYPERESSTRNVPEGGV